MCGSGHISKQNNPRQLDIKKKSVCWKGGSLPAPQQQVILPPTPHSRKKNKNKNTLTSHQEAFCFQGHSAPVPKIE